MTKRPLASTHAAVRQFADECARLWPGCRAIPRGRNRWHLIIDGYLKAQLALREQEDADDK